MKKNRIIIVAITLLLLTSCGSSKVATKTANTTSKTVNDVISEKTNANTAAETAKTVLIFICFAPSVILLYKILPLL